MYEMDAMGGAWSCSDPEMEPGALCMLGKRSTTTETHLSLSGSVHGS